TTPGGLRWSVDASVLAGASFPIALDPIISPEFAMDDPVTVEVPIDTGGAAIASNGDEYLVTWADTRNLWKSFYNMDIYGTRVSADGSILDPQGIGIATARYEQFRPCVASNGVDFFVAWAHDDAVGGTLNTTERDIYGARVSAAGE